MMRCAPSLSPLFSPPIGPRVRLVGSVKRTKAERLRGMEGGSAMAGGKEAASIGTVPSPQRKGEDNNSY